MDEKMIEEMILGMANIVIQKRKLEEENFYLKQKLDESYVNQIEMLNKSKNQVAEILSKVLSKSMEEVNEDINRNKE